MSDGKTSKYVGRWRHRDKLVFRVWPKYKETHQAIVRLKEIPIDGFMMTSEGMTEARYHSKNVRMCAFELRDEDVEVLGRRLRAMRGCGSTRWWFMRRERWTRR